MKVFYDPRLRRAYPCPRLVLDCDDLHAEAKLELLTDWLEQERDLLTAADDGMQASGPSRLDEVAHALERAQQSHVTQNPNQRSQSCV